MKNIYFLTFNIILYVINVLLYKMSCQMAKEYWIYGKKKLKTLLKRNKGVLSIMHLLLNSLLIKLAKKNGVQETPHDRFEIGTYT